MFRLLPFLLLLSCYSTGSTSTGSDYGSDYGSSESCCKYCGESKACGDSCISSSKTCHTSGGCACNGENPNGDEEPMDMDTGRM